jgi:hypothetical protein
MRLIVSTCYWPVNQLSLFRLNNKLGDFSGRSCDSLRIAMPPLYQTPECVVVAEASSNLDAVAALERLVFGEEPWAGERCWGF